MIQLSYTSLNILHTCPHNWLNKVCGIPQPEKPEWDEGKLCHRIIQDHIAGIKKDKRIKYLDLKFPIVEVDDFDERCRFEMPLSTGTKSGKKGEFKIIGFVDGRDEGWTEFVEIKTSSNPWSLAKFKKSYQRKLYALAKSTLKTSTLITGSRNPDDWVKNKLKVYRVPITQKDRQDALKWLMEGIKILLSGDFTSDLENGKCTDPYCYWGANCQFK